MPKAPIPIRAGRYLYSYSGRGSTIGPLSVPTSSPSYSGQSYLIVSAPTTNAGGRLQHESFTFNEGGGYAATDQWDFLYNAAGMYLHHWSTDVMFNGAPYDHADCSGDALMVPTGVHTGDTWHAALVCSDRLSGSSTSSITLTDSGPGEVQVNGRSISSVDISEQWGSYEENTAVDPTDGRPLEDFAGTTSGGGSNSSYSSEKADGTTPD